MSDARTGVRVAEAPSSTALAALWVWSPTGIAAMVFLAIFSSTLPRVRPRH